ncbi:alpha/beta fold hydrolase [Kutzneria kofuensis]|uniref:Pimeloyl-ACP methyl ester carboxylesterase n=1 Tax=Kutzneria kofuensis TaxID=103725 RepID=A0A7W9NDH9_9PSEU|nr:alpha/beta hydrolase [Kutzneria kofuensis]MBB5889282.1 pimeloyl-ACP methyl ester carboxylesterase [Kutzneria kofuensis]
MNDVELAAELGFRSEHADVNGTRLHYVIGGDGEPLVLLPGWPQTWWSYHKVMPKLAERHRVVAVDLRGMGGSAKPADGYDKKTMAADIGELVRHLGHDRVDVAGHDIGSMVAFSLAANHPDTVRKIAMLDVPHPSDSFHELRVLGPGTLWWFAFNQLDTLPAQLLEGRARYLVDHMIDRIAVRRDAITDRDRAIYAAAYDTADAIRAGNRWYQAFERDIEDLRGYEKVTTPVLGLLAPWVREPVEAAITEAATDVRIREIPDSGHYLAEERPDAVVEELTRFFG